MISFLRRHRIVSSIVTLLLVLFLVLDAMVMATAQKQLDDVLRRAAPGADVTARVGGWPVTWHVLVYDELGTVKVHATNITISSMGRALHVSELDADVHRIRNLRGNTGYVTIGSIQGTVRLTWPELSQATGANLALGTDGTLRVTGLVPVLGEHLYGELAGTLALDVQAQQIVMLDPVGTIDGVAVPPEVLSGLITRLSSRFTLPTVPGFTWTKVVADGNGVVLTFTGSDLTIPR